MCANRATGAAEPRIAIDGLGELIYRPDLTAREHAEALFLIAQLVKKVRIALRFKTKGKNNFKKILLLKIKIFQHPVPLLAELPRLVETVVHSLDPNVPHLRESCLKAATQVLHNLVSQFPNVSFHQTTQRLAVGTQKAVIIIWDLKTATRWHVLEVTFLPVELFWLFPLSSSLPSLFSLFSLFSLSVVVFLNSPSHKTQQGHRGPVTAVAFNQRGDMLSSYSVADGRVLFWNTKPSITHIFSSPACIHSATVSKTTST